LEEILGIKILKEGAGMQKAEYVVTIVNRPSRVVNGMELQVSATQRFKAILFLDGLNVGW
jgi:hypothetical protein